MWTYDKEKGLLYFISDNFAFKPAVSIFSFYKTLIKDYVVFTRGTNSGSGTNSAGSKDITLNLFHPSVITFLKNVNTDGGSIIVIENAFYDTHTNIKQVVAKFLSLVNTTESVKIPFFMVFILSPNKFKKPNTNIYKQVEKMYKAQDKNENKIIDKSISILVGANAGRKANYTYRTDDSDVDRAFANNIDFDIFHTPEQIFINDFTPRHWVWSSYTLSLEERSKFLENAKLVIEPKCKDLFKHDIKQLIFISGPPVSGKTLLGNRIKYFYTKVLNVDPLKIIILDINNYKDPIKLTDLVIKTYEEHKNNPIKIIVIDTLGSFLERRLYLAKLNIIILEVPTIFIEVQIDKRLSKQLLNQFKLQIAISPNIKLTTNQTFNKYYSTYVPFDPLLQPNITYILWPFKLHPSNELLYRY